VFGLVDKGTGDSNLVFIPVDDAIRLAKVNNAIGRAKTWGTFCKMMPAKDLRYVIEDYREREEPLPRKRDGFSLPGSFYDGDWPDWPEQMMLNWMPGRDRGEVRRCAMLGSEWAFRNIQHEGRG
jgi:hypothetical protein